MSAAGRYTRFHLTLGPEGHLFDIRQPFHNTRAHISGRELDELTLGTRPRAALPMLNGSSGFGLRQHV